MRIFFSIAFILLTLNVLGQNLELVQQLEDIGAFPARDCRVDIGKKYCAVIHIIIPDVSFSVHAENMVGEEDSITNGKQIFISTSNKKKIRINAVGFLPYEFEAKDLKRCEVYEIKLQKPKKKTWLVLRINEADAKVEIDGKEEHLVEGKEFKKELYFGKYNVYVSKPNFQPEDFEVKLTTEEPVIKDVILRPKFKFGSLTVNVKGRYGATIWLDNNVINNGMIYGGLSSGIHNLRITCGNKTKNESVNIKPNKNVVKNYRFFNPYGKPNENNWFFGFRYSLKSTIGFSFGYGKKYGMMFNAGITPYAIEKMGKSKRFIDNLTLKNIYPSVLLDYDQDKSADSKGVSRLYLHCGPMYRPFDWLSFYITAGYGNYADVKNYDGLYFAPKIHYGIDGEVGAMFKYKRLGLSLGYQRNIGRKSLFNDFVVGVFVWLGK